MNPLAEGIVGGSRRALARALTQIENMTAESEDLLSDLFPHTGRAWVIGVTGAPGTGKSSLVNAMTMAYRKAGSTVAIVAVDPTSPFTGGAILGDRIRMRDLSGDPGVFIRSMATRGSLGGLARTTRDAVRALDAAGFDYVMVETVGAGQSEVEIVRTAHTTIVVEAPGLGDDVQAIKAGILEIADILVVNKADRPGADNTVRTLRAMLELGHPTRMTAMHHGQVMQIETPGGPEVVEHSPFLWLPKVIRTVANRDAAAEDDGIGALVDEIARHRTFLSRGEEGTKQARERIEIELYDRLRQAVFERALAALPTAHFDALVDAVIARKVDPQQAVLQILDA